MFSEYTHFENKLAQEQMDTGEGFITFIGDNSFVISAPHSVSQLRNGRRKIAETRTGLIAYEINRRLRATAFIKTKNMDDDANYDEESVYRDRLIEYINSSDIKLMLDLHISSPIREYDIDIGTAYGKNINNRKDILDTVYSEYKNVYLSTEIDSLFTASYKNTVSASVGANTKAVALQIEINWSIIDNYESMEKFIDTTMSVLNRVKELL